MKYELYYDQLSAAEGVRVILEEIGLPYELIPSSKDRSRPRPSKQLLINPNGWLPVLSWGGNGMYECAAIVIFLCDQHPDAKLAPLPNDPERAVFLQTIIYFSNTLQTAFQTFYYPDRFVDHKKNEASAQRRGIKRLEETWRIIDQQIDNKEWILGKNFSAADIYLFMLTTWLKPWLGQPSIDEFPNVERIAKAVMCRPSVQRVYSNWIEKNFPQNLKKTNDSVVEIEKQSFKL